MNEQCIFCEEYEKGENTFEEDALWRARWDRYPVTPGHVEVLPKRHVQYLEQLTDEELEAMMRFAKRVMGLIRDTDLPDLYQKMILQADDKNRQLQQNALDSLKAHPSDIEAFNFGINDGPAAGQSVPHLHLHLMPRWPGDVENPRGGVRNIFANDTYKDLK